MANWRFYCLKEEKWPSHDEFKEFKAKVEDRQLFYSLSDYVADRHRKVLRFHFYDNKGRTFIWIPGWEDLSRLFRLGALIEKRNSKKDFEFFETGAFKILASMPGSIEECDREIEQLLSEEDIPFF